MKTGLIVFGLAMLSLFGATQPASAQSADYACEMNPPYGLLFYQDTSHSGAIGTCQYLVGQGLTNHCASVGDTDPWQVGIRVWYYASPFWQEIFLDIHD